MSYKLVDKIKKSAMPGTLKKVFEAYASFGNSDGTEIRPTARAVARRASCDRTTVARRTPELVRWGFLIHELNEDGTYRTHAYSKEGVWAYVYRASLAPLENPQIVATFEFGRQELSRKRAAAGAKRGSTKYQLELFDYSNLLQRPLLQIATDPLLQIATTPSEQFATQTIPSSPLRSEELRTTPQTDPSVVGTTEREVSKRVSEADNLPTEEQKRQNQKWLNGEPGTEEDGEEPIKLYWTELHRREFSIEEASTASQYLLELFPRSDLGEADTVLMAEIAMDFQARYPEPEDYPVVAVAKCHTVVTMRSYLDWNRKHKKGGMVHANVAEFHKAWFSDSDRNARIQWEDHDPSACPFCKRKAQAAAAGAGDDTRVSVGKGFDIGGRDHSGSRQRP